VVPEPLQPLMKQFEEERAMLESLHDLLREQPYGDRFDGVYIKEENLGKSNYELDPYFYIADGKLDQGHWDINGVTWWILKHHGITIKGKPVGELPLDVEWGDVEKTMRYNIEHYWKEKKLQQFLDDEWVLFCVETNARTFCTMKFGDIVPKTEAMKQAKDHLGEDWYPVLDEALRLRGEQGSEPHFASTLMRAQTVVNFADHVRRVCEPYFQVQSK